MGFCVRRKIEIEGLGKSRKYLEDIRKEAGPRPERRHGLLLFVRNGKIEDSLRK